MILSNEFTKKNNIVLRIGCIHLIPTFSFHLLAKFEFLTKNSSFFIFYRIKPFFPFLISEMKPNINIMGKKIV